MKCKLRQGVKCGYLKRTNLMECGGGGGGTGGSAKWKDELWKRNECRWWNWNVRNKNEHKIKLMEIQSFYTRHGAQRMKESCHETEWKGERGGREKEKEMDFHNSYALLRISSKRFYFGIFLLLLLRLVSVVVVVPVSTKLFIHYITI